MLSRLLLLERSSPSASQLLLSHPLPFAAPPKRLGAAGIPRSRSSFFHLYRLLCVCPNGLQCFPPPLLVLIPLHTAVQQDVFPAPGPMDTLTGYPLSAQENSTGLLGEDSPLSAFSPRLVGADSLILNSGPYSVRCAASQSRSDPTLTVFLRQVGWSFAFIIYGLVLASFSKYLSSTHFPRDALWRKVLTFAVVGLASVVTLQIIENSFYWSTLQRRSTVALETYRKWDAIGPLFSGLLAFLVQGSYAHRSLGVSASSNVFRRSS